jgi:hypothetical protein
VIASEHKKERVYVTLNGYRWDDFKSYVYKSDNYGVTWENISNNLPASPVNVIKEDPKNENMLYVGTDNGAYVSFDQGLSWQPFSKGLPNVAVHDIAVQKRDQDLVLGTHGRSIYVADISLLQQLSATTMNDLVLAEIPSIRASRRWGSSGFNAFGDFTFEPEVQLQVYAPEGGEAEISVATEDGIKINSWNANVDKGVNVIAYNASISDEGAKALEKKDINLSKAENGTYYLPKGSYKITLKVKGKSTFSEIEVK